MPKCLKCGEKFPISVTIDGKKRNLCSRQYCFKCSPFGKRNTKQLHLLYKRKEYNGPCLMCGDSDKKKAFGSKICFTCVKRRQELERCNKLYSIVGETCWFCGYNKGMQGRPVLDFHHINKNKKFGLTKRNIGQIDFKIIVEEAKKCVLTCCRCHREIHVGIIDAVTVNETYIKKWSEIDSEFDPAIIEHVDNCDLEYMDEWIKKVNDHLFTECGHHSGCKAMNKQTWHDKKCEYCGSDFTARSDKRKYCSKKCSTLADRKVERPSAEQLQEDIKNMNWCELGRKYNVTDNAVRKWARRYGLIPPKEHKSAF